MVGNIRLEQKQSLKQTQSLKMTQQMRQSIELLQKTQLELRDFLIEELSENPYLEVEDWGEEVKDTTELSKEGDFDNSLDVSKNSDDKVKELDTTESNMSDLLADADWNAYKESSGDSFGDTRVRRKNDYSNDFSFENILTKKESLPEYVDSQIVSLEMDDDIKEIMVYMAYNLDEKGFLRDSDEEIAQKTGVELDVVEIARDSLRYLDPPGVGCQDFKEYLKFMFEENPSDVVKKKKGADIVKQIVSDESLLDFISTGNFNKLCVALNVSSDDLKEAMVLMRSISPYPAFGFDNFTPEAAVPDLKVHYINKEIVIELENKFLPAVSSSKLAYEEDLKKVSSKKEKEFVKERYRSAEWIIRSISERNKTLYAVASSIFRFQKSFLEFGEEFLKPLTLKDIADDIEKHQSTVSRLTNGKYAQTPHGVYELKYFFVKRVNDNAPATNKHLETRMLELVETEDRKHPLSDEDISNLLKREGISVARRTITKYREKLKIPSARERKRRYAFY